MGTELLDEARARRELLAAPDKGRRMSNLSHALRLADRPQEALSWGRWAIRPVGWPSGNVDPRALRVLGGVLVDLGLYDEADSTYQQADPERSCPAAQFCRSRALQGLGRWPEAWALAEWRFQQTSLPVGAFPLPHWIGWPNVNRIVLWDEQGYGDTLQSLRWIPLLMKQVPSVLLMVRPALVRLLQEGLSWLGPGLQIQERPQELMQSDSTSCQGSLLSLPWLLQQSKLLDGSVLRVSPRFSIPGRPPRIGLVWQSGRYTHDPVNALEYRRKTLPEDIRSYLQDGLQHRGIKILDLQLGEGIPEETDFLGQAQRMQQCDLLLSVDTAAAHLGGTMGWPTWLMLPWTAASRWQRHTDKSQLYSSMRLFRQPSHQDWPGLMNNLLNALDQENWHRL